MSFANKYLIGKGLLLFKKDGETAGEYQPIGNCPGVEFSPAVEIEDHLSSEEGPEVVDESALKSQIMTANVTCDNLNINTLALFLYATSVSEVSISAVEVEDEEISAKVGGFHNLTGKNIPATGTGALAICTAVEGGGTTLTLNTDYEVWEEAGVIKILEGGTMVEDTTYYCTYTPGATTYQKIQANTTTTIKGHFKFIGNPSVGPKFVMDWYGSITPSGALPVISDSWSEISFELKQIAHADYSPGMMDVYYVGDA